MERGSSDISLAKQNAEAFLVCGAQAIGRLWESHFDDMQSCCAASIRRAGGKRVGEFSSSFELNVGNQSVILVCLRNCQTRC